jgi:predicted transcriptional regulator
MSIAITKVELAKRLLSTNDKGIINHIKAVFESHSSDWWDELPSDIKKQIEKGLAEANRGEGISHEQAMKKYKKWLKEK